MKNRLLPRPFALAALLAALAAFAPVPPARAASVLFNGDAGAELTRRLSGPLADDIQIRIGNGKSAVSTRSFRAGVLSVGGATPDRLAILRVTGGRVGFTSPSGACLNIGSGLTGTPVGAVAITGGEITVGGGAAVGFTAEKGPAGAGVLKITGGTVTLGTAKPASGYFGVGIALDGAANSASSETRGLLDISGGDVTAGFVLGWKNDALAPASAWLVIRHPARVHGLAGSRVHLHASACLDLALGDGGEFNTVDFSPVGNVAVHRGAVVRVDVSRLAAAAVRRAAATGARDLLRLHPDTRAVVFENLPAPQIAGADSAADYDPATETHTFTVQGARYEAAFAWDTATRALQLRSLALK
jgi:hypothetical protein